MKVLLMGMFDRQLRPAVDKLRSEFPDVKFEMIGNDNGTGRQCAAIDSADVVVSGRFIPHKIEFHAKRRGIPFRMTQNTSASSLVERARLYITEGR